MHPHPTAVWTAPFPLPDTMLDLVPCASPPAVSPWLLATSERVQYRVTSGLIEGFSQWWQMPALVLALAAIAAFVLWMYRRDAAELPRGVGLLLAVLRLGAVAAVTAAYLDFERTAEHEIVFPSRVAVLVDSSASMTLRDEPAGEPPGRDGSAAAPAAIQPADGSDAARADTRARQALEVLRDGGLLAALAPRHEVSLWRFDADAEPLTVLPQRAATGTVGAGAAGAEDGAAGGAAPAAKPRVDWEERLAPRGYETRLGEALARVLDQEPTGSLAGVIVLTDGANNAGIDPAAAAALLGKAGVRVHSLGIGSDRLPANVRVADVLVPSRVFPGDRFAVTAYLQSQGLAGQTVRVELSEVTADEAAGEAGPGAGEAGPGAGGTGRVIDTAETILGAGGELVAVRFDVPGLDAPGRRDLAVRVIAPAADRTPADDRQVAEIEVVDRVTQVLLMAGGPSREYQFMRNVLERDKSVAVDVLLGTAGKGGSQDARRILPAFPPTAEELAAYDVVVAFDYDWRLLDAAAQARLERWVSQESGGLVFVAGPIFMDAWSADSQTTLIRNLHPVDLRRAGRLVGDAPAVLDEPMPLVFSRDGLDAEFLWLASSRIASQTVWSEFTGVFSCFDSGGPKPGATVYARVVRPGAAAAPDSTPIYFAGQFYGSGNVFYLGSGEMWRLRALEDSLHERFATQLIRHVSQGRLLRGSRRARLLVDQDRFAVGANVVVRLVVPEGEAAASPDCRVVGPDGATRRLPLVAERDRSGVLQGAFVATRDGSWRIDVEIPGAAGERVSRRIQARLPDRELERPRLDRGVLEQVAVVSGGTSSLLATRRWTVADSQGLADTLPDRSRREYETGSPDGGFKRRLNGLLMALGVGLLCCEWVLRRLVKLA